MILEDIDVFVSVGVNVSYSVCHTLKMVKSAVAVEPPVRNFAQMFRNLQVNQWHRIDCCPVVMGERPTVTKIFGGGTPTSLIKGWDSSEAHSYSCVPVQTLDTILANRSPEKGMLIVIDVQSFELPVLQGALIQLQRKPTRVWFVEVSVDKHTPDGVAVDRNLLPTSDLFWQYGCRVEYVPPSGKPVSRAQMEAWSYGEDLRRTNDFVFPPARRIDCEPC